MTRNYWCKDCEDEGCETCTGQGEGKCTLCKGGKQPVEGKCFTCDFKYQSAELDNLCGDTCGENTRKC